MLMTVGTVLLSLVLQATEPAPAERNPVRLRVVRWH